MADEAKINDGYLSVKREKRKMEGLQKNKNITALEGYDDRKEVILPKIVASQKRE